LGATDLDFVVERKGHFLVIEQKQGGALIPTGQAILLHQLRKQGWTVWVVRTMQDPGIYRLSEWTEYGEELLGNGIDELDLDSMVNEWYNKVNNESKV
jgi:hypothetical protein